MAMSAFMAGSDWSQAHEQALTLNKGVRKAKPEISENSWGQLKNFFFLKEAWSNEMSKEKIIKQAMKSLLNCRSSQNSASKDVSSCDC